MKRLLSVAIVALFLVSVLPAALVFADDWPMLHHDLNHTGQSPYLGAQTATLKWRTHVGVKNSSPTIGANGTIYVGSYTDGGVYAINPDGTTAWRFETGGVSDSPPTIASDGVIYASGNYSGVFALNPDGSLNWTYQTGDYVDSGPAIGSNGLIYVGSEDFNVYAFNPDGSVNWTYATGSYVDAAPAIAPDGTVYVGSNDHSMYAFYPNGTLKWSYATGNNANSSPAIAPDGTIYFGDSDSYLYALFPNGTLKWRYGTGGYIGTSSPAIASDGTIYFGSSDGYFYALNADGTLKWRYLIAGIYIPSSPAIGLDGTIYFGADNFPIVGGWFYALDSSGALKWSYFSIGQFTSSPAISSGGTVYMGSEDGYLYAFQDPAATPPPSSGGSGVSCGAGTTLVGLVCTPNAPPSCSPSSGGTSTTNVTAWGLPPSGPGSQPEQVTLDFGNGWILNLGANVLLALIILLLGVFGANSVRKSELGEETKAVLILVISVAAGWGMFEVLFTTLAIPYNVWGAGFTGFFQGLFPHVYLGQIFPWLANTYAEMMALFILGTSILSIEAYNSGNK